MPTTSNKNLLLPQSWPLWLLVALLWLLSQLPYRVLLKLGAGLGWLLARIPSKSRDTTLTNLTLCFPELTPFERKKLFHKNFRSVGIGVFETALGWWASEKRLKKLIHIDGMQHVENALKQEHGVLLIGMHFTTLHLICRLLAISFPVTLMYRPQKNPVLQYIADKALQQHYNNAIARDDIRGMLRSLKNNMPICYTPDTDAGRKSSIFVPFFGVLAATVTASSRFAQMSGAPVIPSFFERRDDGTGYNVVFYQALQNFPSDDLMQDTLKINQAIETSVRRRPDQYIWQYKRFKTRPEGEKRFY